MRKPTQAQVQEQAQQAARGPVKVAQPAWVLSYDRATQTATIQIATAYKVRNDAGELVARVRPPVANVPVQFCGSVTWDLEEGEWGMALIADRSLDEWKATASQSVDPRDPRRFDVTDAVFLAGVRPAADPLPARALPTGTAPNDEVVIWDRDKGGGIKLGDSTATKAVALDPDVQAQMAILETAILSAVSAAILSVTPPPAVVPDGGLVAFTAFQSTLTAALAAWPSSMGATKVKAV